MRNGGKGYKIAYLCRMDPLNKRMNSGSQFYMVESLRKINNVDIFFVKEPFVDVVRKFLFKLYAIKYKKTKMFTDSLLFARFLGFYFSIKLRKKDYDFIFISRGKTIIPFLDVDIPILYTSDATFRIMYKYNDNYIGTTQKQRQEADSLEQLAIDKSLVKMYPSKWAAESAIRDYGAATESVFIIPSGANFPNEDIPANNLPRHRMKNTQCNVLFVGNNWAAKGGDIAYGCVENLRQKGLPAILTVIGCTPTFSDVPDWVRVIPFLNKNIPEQAKRLADFFIEAHFFILPTRYETFGLVFAEACAYSLPILASDTGGVPTCVEDSVNGYLLPLDASGDEYAQKLISLWENKNKYSEFSINSRRKYETVLNWDAWGNSVQQIMTKSMS